MQQQHHQQRQRRPTKQELRAAALVLLSAGPRDRTGIGGRPKNDETCPLGCGFEGGYNQLRAHISGQECPRNIRPDGSKKLTQAKWLASRRREREREQQLKAS